MFDVIDELQEKIQEKQKIKQVYEKNLEVLREELSGLEVDEEDYREAYDDFIDEYGPIEIMGMEYLASRVLKEVDPIAYNCGLSDYCDSIDLTEETNYIELKEKIEELEYDLEDIDDEIYELKSEVENLYIQVNEENEDFLEWYNTGVKKEYVIKENDIEKKKELFDEYWNCRLTGRKYILGGFISKTNNPEFY